MEMIWYVIAFILGTIIGSFLNVVIYRLHTGKSLNGRSHCMSCGEELYWYELFPIVSYLFLRGRCGACSAHIPSRYFTVELLTGLSFLTVWHYFSHNLILLVVHLILMAILMIILVYDMRHTIIPDELTIAVGVVALILLGYTFYETRDVASVLLSISAGLCAGFFFWGLWFMSKGRWIGLGDAKLARRVGVGHRPCQQFRVGYLAVQTAVRWRQGRIGTGHIARQGWQWGRRPSWCKPDKRPARLRSAPPESLRNCQTRG